MPDDVVLTGARVVLRVPRGEDADELFASVTSDRRVTEYLSWTPHVDVDETRRVIRELFNVGHDHTWVIVLRDTGEIVGQLGYRRLRQEVVEIAAAAHRLPESESGSAGLPVVRADAELGETVASRFQFADLAVPVIAAPMAGGPSTPELAAAATNAGGLGFVPAGYLSADAFADRLVAARALTSGPVGANLFVPQPSAGNRADIDRYAEALAGEARRYGAQLGEPRYDDDQWAAKLDVLLDVRPDVASFTFDAPGAQDIRRLADAGITTVATVTTAAEAALVVSRGVDAVAVQGPSAGGHRGTFDPAARPATQPLPELLAEVVAGVAVPVVAAGGLMTAEDVDAVLHAGAVAAQLGTAFLLSDEAGSSAVHRAALQDPQFTETAVTRAFSGRYARGLRNRFIDEHEAQAPLGYPEVHYLTSPLRAAAVRAGDPHATNVWAGTGFKKARAASVAAIMGELSCR